MVSMPCFAYAALSCGTSHANKGAAFAMVCVCGSAGPQNLLSLPVRAGPSRSCGAPDASADVKQPRAVRAMDTFASYIKGHVTRPSGEPTIGFIVDW